MFHIDFNIGYQLNSTHIQDTIEGFTINQHSIILEPNWIIPIVENKLEVSISPRFVWLQSINNGPTLKGVKGGIFNPEVVLNYYPSKELKNGAHFRWMLFDNVDKNENDVMYWQVGYRLNINEIFQGLVNKKDV